MLKKENKTPIDNKKVNEVVSLSKQVLNILKFLLIIVVVYLTILLLKETGILKFVLTLLKVLLPLFIGFIIAWLFNPVVKWFGTKHINRTFGTIIIYVILCIVLYAIIATFIPLLSNQISEFAVHQNYSH